MSDQGYPITLQIVRDYLATLGPDDSAGRTRSAFECPVARAARYQYGSDFIVTEGYYYKRSHPLSLSENIPTTPEITQLIRTIDASKEGAQSVTRAEVEALLP